MTGDDKLSIVLTLNEWNVVLGIMAKQPYEVVANLIQQIGNQAQQQQAVSQQANAIGSLNGASPLAPVPPAVGPDAVLGRD